ncbi:MAG: hypothetical protein RLZZ630_1733 [Bacteroidota bacterium]
MRRYSSLFLSFIAIVLCLATETRGQQFLQNGNFSGYFETNGQYYRPDSAIGAGDVPEKWLNNAFMGISYNYGNITAGVRYESYLNALQGFDPNYKGNGIVNRFITYTGDKLTVTAGNFYEQFGNGLILRSYWEPNLGVDNSIDGVRAVFTPQNGIVIKGIIGRQRDFFTFGPGIVRGFDGEVQLNDALPALASAKLRIGLGGSFVSKYQRDTKASYVLPENVGAAAGRINLGYGKFAFDAEYAYKINDPSQANFYTYNRGEAFFTNLTYSQKGLGVRLSGKRVDNMDYRSDRDVTGNRLLINYLPAVNRQQTYRLATLYPYATQFLGEMGGSAEVYYNIKPKSKLGGPFGTKVLLSFAAVSDIERKNLDDTLGYTSDFLAIGDDRFYQEFTAEFTRKLSDKKKILVSYMYQIYDMKKLEGKGDQITAHLGVIDYTYRLTTTRSLRVDLEHLYTEQDRGNWAMALLEFNLNRSFSIAVFDEWNYGNDDPKKRTHYFNGLLTYVKGGTRVSCGWARQRAGLLCVGGVCRFVPASNGPTVTISSRF